MRINEVLNKELSYEEINEYLHELMGYSCSTPSDASEPFQVFDDNGDCIDFRKYTGMKGIDTLYGIIFLKEGIDEERGKRIGISKAQDNIKKALGIY